MLREKLFENEASHESMRRELEDYKTVKYADLEKFVIFLLSLNILAPC
jgi:hypothetical protein